MGGVSTVNSTDAHSAIKKPVNTTLRQSKEQQQWRPNGPHNKTTGVKRVNIV